MKILIIGYGSIGKKHFNIIKNNFENVQFFILSKRKIFIKGAKVLKTFEEVKNIKLNYVIISSEPQDHFHQLKFFEKNFKNIKILVEKPLFHKEKKIKIKNNKVFVGYNLRFHPAIIFLKNFLKRNRPIDIKLITNSFLPNWRKKKNYKNYSTDKKKGGGVINDLSHEIDLILWLFGNININYCSFGKISKLKINSEDNLKLFGKIKTSQIFLNLNYFSRNEIRTIFVDTNKNSIFVDVRNNIIKINSKIKKVFANNFNKDKTYLNMHRAILLNQKNKFLCSFLDGKKVLKQIKKIKVRKK